jgi:hypothetical protein
MIMLRCNNVRVSCVLLGMALVESLNAVCTEDPMVFVVLFLWEVKMCLHCEVVDLMYKTTTNVSKIIPQSKNKQKYSQVVRKEVLKLTPFTDLDFISRLMDSGSCNVAISAI